MTDATVEPTVEPTEEATPEVAEVVAEVVTEAEVVAEEVAEAKAPAKKAPAKKAVAADSSAKALPRLKAHYRAEIIAELTKEFGFSNPHQVPNLTKIVVNMGVGDAAKDGKLIDGAVKDLTAITGQRPQINLARKSIAQFKLREGQAIGAHVTLRGDRMWEFLDRLLSLALPRIRDFRGLSDKQFDGNGNYTFGLSEQNVFHEINQDNIDRSRGMDITVVTTARTNDEGRALLKQLGFPFQTK